MFSRIFPNTNLKFFTNLSQLTYKLLQFWAFEKTKTNITEYLVGRTRNWKIRENMSLAWPKICIHKWGHLWIDVVLWTNIFFTMVILICSSSFNTQLSVLLSSKNKSKQQFFHFFRRNFSKGYHATLKFAIVLFKCSANLIACISAFKIDG